MQSTHVLITGQKSSDLQSQELEPYTNRILSREETSEMSIRSRLKTNEEMLAGQTEAYFGAGSDRAYLVFKRIAKPWLPSDLGTWPPSSFLEPRLPMNLGFNEPSRPWLPPKVVRLLNKLKKGHINEKEMTTLIKDMATISAEFYKIRPGKFIALEPDGRIIDSDDSPTDLLTKVQNRRASGLYFLWHVGSEFYSGWKP